MAMHTRRDLLRTSLLLGGAVYAPRAFAQVTATPRSYTAGRFAVLVGGSAVAVESFNILAEPPVASKGLSAAPPAMAAPAVAAPRASALAATNQAVKVPASGPSQLHLDYVLSMSLPWNGVIRAIANWVAGAVNHVPSLLDGTFCSADFTYKAAECIDWSSGVIAQVTSPACEATSTARALPTIIFDSATLHWRPGGGADMRGKFTQIKQKSLRACDFLVTSNANINASQIASVSALTLAPTVYGGTVAFGFNSGFSLPGMPTVLTPFQAAVQAGGMMMRGQSTDIAIQYGLAPGVSITLHDCRVASVNNGPPRPTVTMSYADASLSILAV